MTARTPDLDTLLREVLEARLARLWVALPGRVETYNASEQTVDVLPLVKDRVHEDDAAVALPIIPRCPVRFPRFGRWFLSGPIAVGDTGTLLFHSRSIDRWLASNGQAPVDPVLRHKHHLTDAEFIPGLSVYGDPLSGVAADHMVLGKDGGAQVHVRDAEIRLGSDGASAFVALANLVKERLDTIQAAHDAHTHVLTLSAGTGTAAVTAAPIGALAGVAATKVKAE